MEYKKKKRKKSSKDLTKKEKWIIIPPEDIPIEIKYKCGIAVSDMGRVKGCHDTNIHTAKLLTRDWCNNGLRIVMTYKNKKWKPRIHELVRKYFKPEIPQKKIVFKDGNRWNPAAHNLKARDPRKLSITKVKKVKIDLATTNMKIREIARKHGILPMTVHRIKEGKVYRDIVVDLNEL